MSTATESWSGPGQTASSSHRSRISFSAVFAGALVAVATSLLISLLGAAFGASGALSTMLGAAINAGGASPAIGEAGIHGTDGWTILSLILGMLLGGYVAARLSGTHSHLDGELHGITMWGLAVLLGLLAVAVIRGPSGATGGAGQTGAAGTAAGTGAALPPSAIAQFQEMLGNSTDPTTMSRGQISNEISDLLGRDLSGTGAIAGADRNRLIALIAAQYGLNNDQASQRLTSVENAAKERLARIDDERRAQAATISQEGTDTARALFTSLVLGLLAALAGAWLGTRHKRVLHPEEAHAHVASAAPMSASSPMSAGSYGRVEPMSVSIYDDTWRLVSQYLLGASFPMSKQDLLSYAQASHASAPIIHDIERLADRKYANANEVLTAIGAM